MQVSFTGMRQNSRHLPSVHPWLLQKYFLPTMPDTAGLLVPLDEFINTHFIPVLTGQESVHDTEKQLIALPTHLEGLSLTIQSRKALFEHTHL